MRYLLRYHANPDASKTRRAAPPYDDNEMRVAKSGLLGVEGAMRAVAKVGGSEAEEVVEDREVEREEEGVAEKEEGEGTATIECQSPHNPIGATTNPQSSSQILSKT